jgi:putative inorganic carbon (HCO3(-)) transporter
VQALGFGLYLVFVCSWFLHLPARFPALAAVRADLVLVCVILAACLATRNEDADDTANRQTRRMLWCLLAYAALSAPLVEWPGSVIKIGIPQFFKAFVFFYFTSALVTTPRRLKWLLTVFVVCESFRVLEPLYLHVTQGYWGSRASMANWEAMDRLSGAPDDVVNPNGLASIVLTIVPLWHYLTGRSLPARLAYVATLPLLLYALVLTASRSGMIGLAGIMALVWVKSRHKVLLTAVTACAIAFAIPRLSADMTDRYVSIFDNTARNAATAGERSEGLWQDVEVVKRRPLFGHGLGTSKEANAHFGAFDRPSHNLYTEVAQELGIVGLGIFLMFMWSLLAGLRRAGLAIRGAPAAPPIVQSLVAALQVWFGMDLLFSLASYGLSSYDWYMMAGLIEVVHRLTPSAQPVTAPVAVPNPHAAAIRQALRAVPLRQ